MLDDGCLIEDGHCQRVIHAEVNAIAQAAKNGINIDGAIAYIYKDNLQDDIIGIEPCRECKKVLRAVNITYILME